MTEPENPLSDQPQDESARHEHDLTVDLTLDESEVVDDLQALADEAAEELPEKPASKGTAQNDELSALFNEELERTLLEARDRIQELEKREAEHLDKHHRLLADFSNYRNRTARDIQMAVDLSERKLLLEILPVLDNFERCIGSKYQSVDDFRNGVLLIQKQFLDALRRMGVETVKLAVGEPFDALHAEALSTISDSKLPDGAIAAVYERGYTLREHLLRAARVVVNHYSGSDTETNH
jgi:molecular chaperone GrpE